jgi:hypothetical protein
MAASSNNNSTACFQCRQRFAPPAINRDVLIADWEASRHLKCGGETPSCHRCLRAGTECTIVPSRRGQGRRRRRTKDYESPAGRVESTTFASTIALEAGAGRPNVPNGTAPSDSVSQFHLSDNERAHLSNLYYMHFHPAHPILRPQKFAAVSIPHYLHLLMCLIGHRYDSLKPAIPGMSEALDTLMASPDEQTPNRMR